VQHLWLTVPGLGGPAGPSVRSTIPAKGSTTIRTAMGATRHDHQAHLAPGPDGLVTASLHAIASRHGSLIGSGRGTDRRAAVTEVRDRAAGRTDLLAEVAGIVWGSGSVNRSTQWWRAEPAAVLLLEAGADPDLVPRWFEIGQQRARMRTHSI
jgi:hypothetical protein